jgi:SAM-dependent methyltransferase
LIFLRTSTSSTYRKCTSLYSIFPLIGGINYSRLAEWKFVLGNLPPPPGAVLDTGSTTSLFPFKLRARGYETYSLDQRRPNFRLSPDIRFHRGDLMNLGIKSGTFDAVTCISTIEHIGMGKYDDPRSPAGGDLRAIKELLRILKPSGRLIVTTNICRETFLHDDEIRYGPERLDLLAAAGKLLKMEYRCFDGRRWRECDRTRAFNHGPDDFGLALFVLSGSPDQSAGEPGIR